MYDFPKHGGSYLDSPEWTENKKSAINPINKKDSKCFQCATTVALNHEKVKKDPQRITKIKLFINKYNWEEINFPTEKNDWKKSEKNTVTISFNDLYNKIKKNTLPTFVNKTQIVKNKLFFYWFQIEKNSIFL